MNTAWPWLAAVFATIVAVVALMALEDAEVMQVLQYERAAVADGEYWRLLSSHLVHFSGSHLVANVCVFTVLAVLIERCHGWPFLALLLGWLALTAGMALPLITGMQFYGGLSAVCYGLLTWVGLGRAGFGRLVPGALMAHTLWQGITGSSLLGFTVPAGTVVAWQAHLACMLGAFALGAIVRVRRPASFFAMP